MQPLPTQVLLQSHREQGAAATQRAERRALREQTTSLRTERARLQGELAALRTRLIQVFVLESGEIPRDTGESCKKWRGSTAGPRAGAGKRKVGPAGFSVSTFDLAMVPSSEAAPEFPSTL